MITNRAETAIHIVKINRIIKTLNYLTDLGSDFVFTNIDPDAMSMDIWLKDVFQYWSKDKSSDITYQVVNLGTSESVKKALEYNCLSEEEKSVLRSFLKVFKEFRKAIQDDENRSKGSYYLLPEEIANEKAAKLMQRAVNAGLLDDRYQPVETTTRAHLRLIAYAISKELNLKNRWKPFNELWNIRLINVMIPRTKTDLLKSVTDLYPGVDFTLETTNKHFTTSRSREDLTRVFQELQTAGYISDGCKLEDWFSVAGIGGEIHTVNWLKGVRKLAYFIYLYFHKENSLDIWEITENCFSLNGTVPNRGTLRTSIQCIEKKFKLLEYDPELVRISKL